MTTGKSIDMVELAAKLVTALESALIDPNYIKTNRHYLENLVQWATPLVQVELDHPTCPHHDRPGDPGLD